MKSNPKSLAHRIAYYTKKVAEYGSIHPAKPKPRSHRFRHNRLMIYKALLHNQIEENELLNSHKKEAIA